VGEGLFRIGKSTKRWLPVLLVATSVDRVLIPPVVVAMWSTLTIIVMNHNIDTIDKSSAQIIFSTAKARLKYCLSRDPPLIVRT
jgi:hypothetical protein